MPSTKGLRNGLPRRRILGRGVAAAILPFLRPADAAPARAGDVPLAPGGAVAGQAHRWPNARAVAVSADGTLVAGASVDVARGTAWSEAGRVAVWETATGRLVRVIQTRGDVIQVRFSADGRWLVIGVVRTLGDAVDDDATVVHAIDGTVEPVRFPGSGVFAVDPRGADLLLPDPNAFCLRVSLPRGDDAERVSSIREAGGVEGLAYSSDGGSFAALHRTREPVEVSPGNVVRTLLRLHGLAVFDAASMRPRAVASTAAVADCSSLDVAAGGKWVATGHRDGAVRLWNGATLEPTATIRGEEAVPVLVTFSPDGSELAVLSQPSTPGEAPPRRCRLDVRAVPGLELRRRFDVEDGGVPVSHPRRDARALNPRRLAYLPGGDAVVIGVAGVSLVDVNTGEVTGRFDAAGSTVDRAAE